MNPGFLTLLKKFNIQQMQLAEKASFDWFRKKIQPGLTSTMSEAQLKKLNIEWSKNQSAIAGKKGFFYTFTYNPKHKKTLPYYDRFPLILVLKLYKNGFLGLNFHYLAPRDRAMFMDRLSLFERTYKVTNEQFITFINVNYETLKKSNALRYYKPCIKRYLFSHIGSFFTNIRSDELRVALFLPTEQFTKQSKVTAWTDSKKTINKT